LLEAEPSAFGEQPDGLAGASLSRVRTLGRVDPADEAPPLTGRERLEERPRFSVPSQRGSDVVGELRYVRPRGWNRARRALGRSRSPRGCELARCLELRPALQVALRPGAAGLPRRELAREAVFVEALH